MKYLESLRILPIVESSINNEFIALRVICFILKLAESIKLRWILVKNMILLDIFAIIILK